MRDILLQVLWAGMKCRHMIQKLHPDHWSGGTFTLMRDKPKPMYDFLIKGHNNEVCCQLLGNSALHRIWFLSFSKPVERDSASKCLKSARGTRTSRKHHLCFFSCLPTFLPYSILNTLLSRWGLLREQVQSPNV